MELQNNISAIHVVVVYYEMSMVDRKNLGNTSSYMVVLWGLHEDLCMVTGEVGPF